MAEIRAFKGLRYSADAGKLSNLVAPPYDVISPAERIGYGAHSPYNIVHLTLPEGKIDDRSKFVKYARGSALLSEWRRGGILVPEDTPTLYRYTQHFELGEGHNPFVRTSLLCLLKIEPFENGVVLPHEQTFAGHKEDRLRLLEATRAHLESIFGLYEDPSGVLHQAILKAPVGAALQAQTGNMTQLIEPLAAGEVLPQLISEFKEKRIWIADGHHRYETALAFRQALGERDHPVAEDFILIALTSMADPGLVLLPTHRVVPNLKDLTDDQVIEKLEADFEIERCHSSRLGHRLRDAEVAGTSGFGIALEGGHGFWMVARDSNALAATLDLGASERLRRLDTTILHRIIFERRLGLSPSTHMEFVRDASEAILTANEGGGAAFLMVPPSMEDMKEIALKGERMPHKSTYYFPKIWSGFAAWALEDFQV